MQVFVSFTLCLFFFLCVCESECKRAALAAIKCPIMAIMELKFSIKILAQRAMIAQCKGISQHLRIQLSTPRTIWIGDFEAFKIERMKSKIECDLKSDVRPFL